MMYKVLHPNGVDVLIGKPGVSLQVKGDVVVRSVEVAGDECIVSLGSDPSMILLDQENVVWIFAETCWKDLFETGPSLDVVYQRS